MMMHLMQPVPTIAPLSPPSLVPIGTLREDRVIRERASLEQLRPSAVNSVPSPSAQMAFSNDWKLFGFDHPLSSSPPSSLTSASSLSKSPALPNIRNAAGLSKRMIVSHQQHRDSDADDEFDDDSSANIIRNRESVEPRRSRPLQQHGSNHLIHAADNREHGAHWMRKRALAKHDVGESSSPVQFSAPRPGSPYPSQLSPPESAVPSYGKPARSRKGATSPTDRMDAEEDERLFNSHSNLPPAVRRALHGQTGAEPASSIYSTLPRPNPSPSPKLRRLPAS